MWPRLWLNLSSDFSIQKPWVLEASGTTCFPLAGNSLPFPNPFPKYFSTRLCLTETSPPMQRVQAMIEIGVLGTQSLSLEKVFIKCRCKRWQEIRTQCVPQACAPTPHGARWHCLEIHSWSTCSALSVTPMRVGTLSPPDTSAPAVLKALSNLFFYPINKNGQKIKNTSTMEKSLPREFPKLKLCNWRKVTFAGCMVLPQGTHTKAAVCSPH